jgi:hypothetical protein
MARLTATNFTAPLQFPYATAGTDLFLKEDVQVLAQAVDQHDHSAGKGLILPLSAIPPMDAAHMPAITTAMIQDRTIQSADIGLGQVTTAEIANGAVHDFHSVGLSSVWSSSATGWQTIAPSIITFTATGVLTRVDILVSFTHTNTNQGLYLGYAVDGSPYSYQNLTTPPVAGTNFIFAASYWLNAPSPGSHQWAIAYNQTGTLTLSSGLSSYFSVTEFRR